MNMSQNQSDTEEVGDSGKATGENVTPEQRKEPRVKLP